MCSVHIRFSDCALPFHALPSRRLEPQVQPEPSRESVWYHTDFPMVPFCVPSAAVIGIHMANLTLQVHLKGMCVPSLLVIFLGSFTGTRAFEFIWLHCHEQAHFSTSTTASMAPSLFLLYAIVTLDSTFYQYLGLGHPCTHICPLYFPIIFNMLCLKFFYI